MTNLKANALGDTTAENDKKMLTEAFVPTADFRTLIETDERTVVVGRRGTGKSALYIQLQKYWSDDKKIVVLCFSPEDTEIIGFRSLLKPFSTSFNLARASTRLLWRYAMLMEIAAYIRGNYKLAHLVEGDETLREHLQRWGNVKGNLLTKCRHIAKTFLSSASPEEAVGDLPINLDLNHIENKVLSLTSTSERRFVLLMDRLDEGYEPDEIGIGIITGLVYASIELNKRSEKIRPIIFLRDNIYRAVAKEDPDYSRNIEGQVIRLHWDWAQLLLLAASRMRVCFGLDVEKDQRIWDRCTAGELQGRDGFKHCLQFTLYRPRDLLSLLNEAFYSASRQSRSTAVFSDLEFAAKSISVARLEDLWKEYQKVFPSIQIMSNAFADGEPEFEVGTATQTLSSVIEKLSENESQAILRDVRLLEPSGILQGLYSVGFLGVHEVTAGAFTFCHDGRTPDVAFENRARLLIHPCYWLGLNLSRNALMPEEAEEITDEYDIKVQSATPEIRNTRIGQTITQLDKIAIGAEGQREFELWCLDALRIAFAAHLTNIQSHPNGAAVQRRDIVGRNREESEFWCRVKSDYKVRQAIFEVKNYAEPGATEYRQLQSYLTGTYGTLGFMITRDTDEHLHSGKDLDWIKEMHQSHGVVLIKLPAKYICKLLQKLRSPDKHDAVDQQISILLDTYERNYLGIKSTRSKKR
ncbi:MAG: ATP-binding protein [Paraburkholderia sp.]|uniref:P-loop ATPase, Sll1717 family n=1 Tax=Paraburkholderia sp. TaxID=1926495 RepID=UPI001219A270|nr:ATP-binding protein [Paraburkholderia sp.]TAL93379.1 MAG: ATP-binding protein [Paraburkholderia sp.]